MKTQHWQVENYETFKRYLEQSGKEVPDEETTTEYVHAHCLHYHRPWFGLAVELLAGEEPQVMIRCAGQEAGALFLGEWSCGGKWLSRSAASRVPDASSRMR
jgi:hypothetical protein